VVAHVGLETLGQWGWWGLNRDGSVRSGWADLMRSGLVVWAHVETTPMLSIGVL
jgi:hypothetical protein